MVAMRLILASASPRRAELLRAAGFDFEIRAVNLDERVRAGELPQEYVRRLAEQKSAAALDMAGRGRRVAQAEEHGVDKIIVIGADTAVVVDGDILGKPGDAAEATSMLRRLSGRQHEVVTGVSLRGGPRAVIAVEATVVSFADLEDQEVDWYIRSGDWRDKAGAYAIQGLAGRFVNGIAGSYSNVVGLPVAVVYKLLKDIEIRA